LSAEEANQKAMQLAEADHSFVNSSQREWAKAIGCSIGQVSNLPFFRATMKHTGRGRRGNAPAPKAVGLTGRLEAAVGEGERDEVLNKLIARDERGRKPSPLEDDPSDSRPHKFHYRKRV
jgi:hypothetical protein